MALLKLETPLQFSPHISPICLPGNNDLLIGENATVAGRFELFSFYLIYALESVPGRYVSRAYMYIEVRPVLRYFDVKSRYRYQHWRLHAVPVPVPNLTNSSGTGTMPVHLI